MCCVASWWWNVWQFWIEIEDYSVANFKRIAAYKALHHRTSTKGGAHTPFVDTSDIHVSMKHVWAPPLAEVQWYAVLNEAKRPKQVTE